MAPTLRLVALFGPAVVALAACDNGTTSAPLPLYVAPVVEGGSAFSTDATSGDDASDAGAPRDATLDTTGMADAGHEASSPPETGPETGPANEAATDSAIDSSLDAPDARADGATTDASTGDGGVPPADAAGPGDGGACSIDGGTCVPVCTGSAATLGWYYADGTLICLASCTGSTAKCEHVGQGSQGWYGSTSGSGCPTHSTEILNDPNCNK